MMAFELENNTERDIENMKNLELDKICRVCLAIKKEMRPLFGEMICELLMECTRIKIDDVDGWPDKICVQCIHQVSRCHAFKTRVEKSDEQLRKYIKGLTVIIEPDVHQIELKRPQTYRSDIVHAVSASSPMIITNARINLHQQSMLPGVLPSNKSLDSTQILNNSSQYTGQMLSTSGTHFQPSTQIGLLQGGNIQMIAAQNGGLFSTDMLQIVQPDFETQYFEDALPVTDYQQHSVGEKNNQIQNINLTSFKNIATSQINSPLPQESKKQQCHIDNSHETIIEEVIEDEMPNNTEDGYPNNDDNTNEASHSDSDYSDPEEKLQLGTKSAEFISFQTSCPSPGRHVCNLCHKEFSQARWLQSHMTSHSNWIKANCKKQPQCDVCHRTFRGPGMLKMHMKTHEKINRLPTCTICNREFKTKSILYRHRQSHFEKIHKCTVCNKNFNSNYQLNSHLARHRGEKSHKCTHCEKAFYTASDLKNHIQQHLGIKIIQIKKVSSSS